MLKTKDVRQARLLKVQGFSAPGQRHVRRDNMNKSTLITNEDGTVLVISLVILALLTVIGIAVTTTSSIELQIAGNQKSATESFYRAEAGLAHSAETSHIWLPVNSPMFMVDGNNEDEAGYPADGEDDVIEDVDGDGTVDVKIEIRRIENHQVDTHLSDEADRLPLISHKSPPPRDYSMKYFEVRRYGITVTAENDTRLQTGVWKVFNKQ